MKIYCFYEWFEKFSLAEIEVEEKPKSYRILNKAETEKHNIFRSVIHKTEIGTCLDYGTICFGLTKEQAISGILKYLNQKIDQKKKEIQKLESKTEIVSNFLKESE